MQIGQAEIDFEAHQINGPAGNYAVEPKVMEVLSVLIENSGQVVTREALIDQVWGVGYGGDERLSRAISLLRKSLGDTRGQHKLIQTIPKVGYKFIPSPDIAVENKQAGSHNSIYAANDTLEKTGRRRLKNWMIIGLSALIIAMSTLFFFGKDIIFSAEDAPLVMIMDSAHPARVYDDQVIADGGTNADILSDILDDLPIRTQKELISPSWHRYEAIMKFKPDLIVIHYSGFKQADSSGDRPQLRLLVEYFSKTDTKFLIYSRASEEWLDGNMNIILKRQYDQNPSLEGRVEIFPLLEYGEPNWMDQSSSQGIKLKIKDMLSLE